MKPAQYFALACTSPWWASITAFALYGAWTLTRRATRAARAALTRTAAWLRQPRTTTQPSFDQHAEQACDLTDPTPPDWAAWEKELSNR